MTYKVGDTFKVAVPWNDDGMTLEITDTTVAVITNRNGEVEDLTYNWESAENYILDSGYLATAIKDDGIYTRGQLQEIFDNLAKSYADCRGISD